jgi:hypothetical protein
MMSTAAATTTHTIEARISLEDETRCQQILALWMAALNRYDATAMDALMRFPHVRLSAGKVTVYDTPGNNTMDLFDRLRQQEGWYRSDWNETKLVQASPTKAHYALVTRVTGKMARLSASTTPSTYSRRSTATGESSAARVLALERAPSFSTRPRPMTSWSLSRGDRAIGVREF